MEAPSDAVAALMARTNPNYRRNGKLQSCEPCRKSKLRCDHLMPVCGRCSHRKKADQCVYHPAPLTRSKDSLSSRASRSPTIPKPPTSYPTDAQRPSIVSRPESVNLNIAPPTPSLSSISASTSDDKRPTTSSSFRVHRNPGFLGITSYRSIFTENQVSLGIDNTDQDPECTVYIGDEKIQKGVEILSLLTHLPAFERFIARWFDISQGILVIEPMVKQWTEALWSFHGDVLVNRDPQQMRQLSELVWRNTQRPLKFDGTTTARRWANMCTGPQLRWEVVGILFAMVGLCAATVPQSDPIFSLLKDIGMDRGILSRTMNNAADTCQDFCNASDVLHDLYLWLIYENFVLTCSIRGDADFVVWKRSGELFNTVLALGLHQEKKADGKTPFFLAEIRKKSFLYAFANDKGLCTFLGRPPRLLSRYCMIQLPLDLSEKQLYSEGAELEAAIASLDESGWNRSGEIRRTTWARVWFINSLIREEILDMSLSLSIDDIHSRAEAILQRAKAHYDSFPESLKQTVENTERLRRPPLEQLCVLFTRLQHMTNDLLLQRVVIRRAGADVSRLISIARNIFQEVVNAAVRRDLMRDFQVDYADLVSCSSLDKSDFKLTSQQLAVHGLRSAAILAVELLKQEHSSGPSSPNAISRSETIQNLSVFVSCLASIDPSDGTYAICEQARKVFKRVLDKILSPTAPLPPPDISLQRSESGVLPTPDSFNFGLPPSLTTDADLMQWLDNMEWERGSLMNFG